MHRRYRFYTICGLGIIVVCLVLATLTIGYAWNARIHSNANGIISGLVACAFLFATAQQGDIILINGKKFSIFTNPLEPFFEQNPGALPNSKVISSANWRGYVATWKVKDDRFMLTNIEILDASTKTDPDESLLDSMIRDSINLRRSVMSTVFSDRVEVLAVWFTGHVIIPEGELVNYVHMGYGSTYEKYTIVRVEKGIVTRFWAADNAEFLRFCDTQFDEYKKTEEYRKALSRIDEGLPEERNSSTEENEKFLRDFYSERYISLIFDAKQ